MLTRKKPTVTPPRATLLEGKPLTKKELAEWGGVSTRFIEVEVKEGRLRCVYLGSRTVRFLPADINTWLNTRRARGAANREDA